MKPKLDIIIDEKFLTNKNSDAALRKAAKKIVDDLHKTHFNPKKKQGWPLDYGMLVTDVFYEAFGHHLETYLLHELFKKKAYGIKTSDNEHRKGSLVLYKLPKKIIKHKRKSK